MLFPVLLMVATLMRVSSGQTLSADSSVNDTQNLATDATSYLPYTLLVVDPTVSQFIQTPSTLQSFAGSTETSYQPPGASSAATVTSASTGAPPVISTVLLTTTTMDVSPVTTSIYPSIPPIATSIPPIATSIPPMPTSIPPIATSIPPIPTSIPPVTTSIPPITTSIPPIPTSIPPIATSIPPIATSIPPVPTSIPPIPTSIPPIATSIPPVTTSIPPITTSIPPITTSIPPVTTSIPSTPPMTTSTPQALPPSSLHNVLITSSDQVQTTPSQAVTSSPAGSSNNGQGAVSWPPNMLQTTAAEVGIYPSVLQVQASTDTTPWKVSVAVLAVLTLALLIMTCVLAIALCVAICRYRARNLTYTIKNPEAKESKYWIETKANQSEGKASPVQAEEGEKVWYAESATAFPVFPMAHLAAARDPTDSSPSVQTFRLARAYKQHPAGNNATSHPQAVTPATTAAPSALSPKAETNVGGGEAVGRTIVIPTTPTPESDLGKAKKRRPPPLKPITAVQAESQEGTYTKHGGTSHNNPTTPGSCSVHKGQVYTGADPRTELMKEYSAILQGKQNNT